MLATPNQNLIFESRPEVLNQWIEELLFSGREASIALDTRDGVMGFAGIDVSRNVRARRTAGSLSRDIVPRSDFAKSAHAWRAPPLDTQSVGHYNASERLTTNKKSAIASISANAAPLRAAARSTTSSRLL
ncbi:MAG: hypothetical protein M1570_02805 [Chloroflexi bacterium]|nr:hypothetical protein [Chloroflexota bacterium]